MTMAGAIAAKTEDVRKHSDVVNRYGDMLVELEAVRMQIKRGAAQIAFLETCATTSLDEVEEWFGLVDDIRVFTAASMAANHMRAAEMLRPLLRRLENECRERETALAEYARQHGFTHRQ